jgi:hypothetical protein
MPRVRLDLDQQCWQFDGYHSLFSFSHLLLYLAMASGGMIRAAAVHYCHTTVAYHYGVFNAYQVRCKRALAKNQRNLIQQIFQW